MRQLAIRIPITLCLVFTALSVTAEEKATESAKPAVRGDYVEIRSCDIYNGRCFANGEMGLIGKEAIMAWSINQGE
ncbi:MAG: hypothetical protein ACYTGQ_15865, partial [Planctomycetota bacterium]